MRISLSLTLALVTLSSAATAQSYLYSWPGCDTTEGNSNNTFPFYGNTHHYQQIHGDLKGSVHVIKGISLRRDGTISISSATKDVTGGWWVGSGDYASATGTFATNYNALGRTNVVPTTTTLSLPPMPPKPVSPPANFTCHIPFSSPYISLGTDAFIWECDLTKLSTTASYIMDANNAGGANMGPYTLIGTGCIATGQTRAMLQRCYVQAYAGPNRFRYYSYTNYGAKSAASMIAVGLTNPNIPFPICSKRLYTDASVLMLPGTSSTSGYFNSGTAMYMPYIPGLVGQKLYTQTYTADIAQAPLPIAVSNGVESVIPAAPPPTAPVCRIYGYNNTTGTGSIARGYVLATRFNK
jgi:hypothetical protein